MGRKLPERTQICLEDTQYWWDKDRTQWVHGGLMCKEHWQVEPTYSCPPAANRHSSKPAKHSAACQFRQAWKEKPDCDRPRGTSIHPIHQEEHVAKRGNSLLADRDHSWQKHHSVCDDGLRQTLRIPSIREGSDASWKLLDVIWEWLLADDAEQIGVAFPIPPWRQTVDQDNPHHHGRILWKHRRSVCRRAKLFHCLELQRVRRQSWTEGSERAIRSSLTAHRKELTDRCSSRKWLHRGASKWVDTAQASDFPVLKREEAPKAEDWKLPIHRSRHDRWQGLQVHQGLHRGQ